EAQAGPLPESLHAPYAAALGDAMLLPVGLALVGVLAALLIGKPVDTGVWAKGEGAARVGPCPARSTAPARRRPGRAPPAAPGPPRLGGFGARRPLGGAPAAERCAWGLSRSLGTLRFRKSANGREAAAPSRCADPRHG